MAEMTEPGELSLPPAADPIEPLDQGSPPPARRSRLPAIVAIVCVVLLAIAVGWLWRAGYALTHRVQQVEQAQQQAQQQATDPSKLAALTDQLQALDGRVAKLEARPLPTPAAPPPDAPPPVDLKPLEDRIAALEQRPAVVVPDESALKGQVQGLVGQLDALGQKVTSTQTQADAAADRAARTQQLQAASTALSAGRPLGSIPGAPAALAQFATEPPPTEAALRLAFPDAARQATEASRPSLAGESLAARMWTRAQSLVTVKQGDKVLVGAPAAATLASAQQRLDAGDLGGTLQALDALDPAATRAMLPWRKQAQSLLDARAALSSAVAALAHG